MDGALTLLDMSQVVGPKGSLFRDVVDVLRTSSHFTEDGIWVESNAFGKHITPQWSTETSGESRWANRGVPISKGSVGVIEDSIGFFEDASVIDNFVMRRVPEGKKQQFRQMYDVAHTRGMIKQQRTNSAYGNPATDDNQPNGLITRRASIGDYCYDAGHAIVSKRTSLLIMAWDTMNGVSNIYPEGSMVGLEQEDYGKQIIVDPDNTDVQRLLPLWITWFTFDYGIKVADDAALFRIANINPDSVTAADYTAVYNLLNEAMRNSNFDPQQLMIYGNTDGLRFIDNMATYVPNLRFGRVEMEGRTFAQSFNGTPLRLLDELSSSETDVS